MASTAQGRSLTERLFTRRAGGMLARNTVVSTGTFAIGVGVLWALVQFAGMNQIVATAVSFLVAQSVHYLMGRLWIFRGTDRELGKGYAIFLANAGMGMAVTVGLFALLTTYTPVHYLVARVIVSVFAGLAMFAVNATLNFRRV